MKCEPKQRALYIHDYALNLLVTENDHSKDMTFLTTSITSGKPQQLHQYVHQKIGLIRESATGVIAIHSGVVGHSSNLFSKLGNL